MRCKDCPEMGGDREICCVAAISAPDWSGLEARVLADMPEYERRKCVAVPETGNRRERRAKRAKARRA